MAGGAESGCQETMDLISLVGLSADPPYKEWGKDLTLSTGPQLMLGRPLCRWCGFSETPFWRRGPSGLKTLCNACGLAFWKAERAWAARMAFEAICAANVSSNEEAEGKSIV